MSHELPLSRAILAAKERGAVPVMADIKPISPRDGDLLGDRKPADLARALAQAGACALSVVTEPKSFGGSIEVLREVAGAVPLPVLQKDFFSRPEQVAESHNAGAGAVLLTLATMEDSLASALYQRVLELGMEAVVEVHTAEELRRALRLNPTIIGINNRDILALEKDPGDVRVTEELAPLVPEEVLTISESSLKSQKDVRRAILAGADAVLVGTAILQSEDPGSCVAGLVRSFAVD